MTGGTVIETIVLEDRIWVNCRDSKTDAECAVCVEPSVQAQCISERDDLRWEKANCYWTPRERIGGRALLKEVKLIRVGTVGVKRPVVKTVAFEGVVNPSGISS